MKNQFLLSTLLALFLCGQSLRLSAQRYVEFLYRDVLQQQFRQVHEVIVQEGEGCDYHPAGFQYCK